MREVRLNGELTLVASTFVALTLVVSTLFPITLVSTEDTVTATKANKPVIRSFPIFMIDMIDVISIQSNYETYALTVDCV
jgi:hypothetical protein